MLDRDGIATAVYYPEPPHLSRAYFGLGYARGDFPVAERFADTSLALPFGPHLRADEQEIVADSVRFARPPHCPERRWRRHVGAHRSEARRLPTADSP